jgi:cytochrome b561
VWNTIARRLHWLMAILLIMQWAGGKIGHAMDKSPLKLDLMLIHKSTGIVLLILALLRLTWRLTHRSPDFPTGSPAWERRAAAIGHGLLYTLMLALPMSGWIMNSAKDRSLELYWLIPWPAITGPDKALADKSGQAHEALAMAFLLVLLIHVAAALRHHFIKRNDVLKRMLNGSNGGGTGR